MSSKTVRNLEIPVEPAQAVFQVPNIKDALKDHDASIQQVLYPAMNWMQQYNIVSEWHVNAIIIDLMSSIKYLNNVEMEIDKDNNVIKCTVVIGLYTLINKWRIRKIEKRIYEVYSMYAPGYTIDIGYKYGRRVQS